MRAVQAADIDSDLFVEVLGILVNVDIPSYDWPALIAKHDLLNLLAGQPHTHVWLFSSLLSHGDGFSMGLAHKRLALVSL